MAEEKETQTVTQRVLEGYIVNLETQLKNLDGIANELVKDASDETLKRLNITRPEDPKKE
jgi:hypothetical protein